MEGGPAEGFEVGDVTLIRGDLVDSVGISDGCHPIQGTWSVTTMEEFRELGAEVSGFVRDLAVPFVDEHRDPLAIRRTLIETPGHATNIWPYRPLLAIDCLYGSPEQTASDVSLLEQRYAHFAPHPRKEFDDFVAAVRKWILA